MHAETRSISVSVPLKAEQLVLACLLLHVFSPLTDPSLSNSLGTSNLVHHPEERSIHRTFSPLSLQFLTMKGHNCSLPLKTSFFFTRLSTIFPQSSSFTNSWESQYHHKNFPALYVPTEAVDDLLIKVICAMAFSLQHDFYHAIQTPISPLCDLLLLLQQNTIHTFCPFALYWTSCLLFLMSGMLNS